MGNELNAKKQRGFTLKELLFLMVGIVVVISVVLPMLSQKKFDVQYRAAAEVLTSNRNDVIKYVYRYDNFWGLPDTELSAAEMKQYFGIDDTDDLPNMGPVGGTRESLSTFKLYQYIDKAAFFAPEKAPELLAMAVHVTKAGEFEFDYHYYHSDYKWDYPDGAQYVDFDSLTNE